MDKAGSVFWLPPYPVHAQWHLATVCTGINNRVFKRRRNLLASNTSILYHRLVVMSNNMWENADSWVCMVIGGDRGVGRGG